MSDPEPVAFFVSYTSADRRWAEWIAWQLEEEGGYRVVIQAWDFRPGQNFALQMDAAMAESERTLVVLSPAFLEAVYTQPEWAAAFRKDPTGSKAALVPVRVREVEAPPGELGSRTWIDLVGLDDAEAQRALLAGVKRDRAKPESVPPLPISDREAPAKTRAAFPSQASPGPPVWNVPPAPTLFEGRDELLTQLREQFERGKSATLVQAQALHGLGGVGKTRVAIEYARRHATDYDVVWWVRAEDEAARVGEYAALGAALGIDEPDQHRMLAVVRRWLETHGRWLLVLDNAPGAEEVEALLPAGRSGDVLLTSRRQGGWRGLAGALPVDVWSRQESIEFLQQRSGDRDPGAAAGIAEALGDLPLALEQAGAYADSKGISLAGYLGRMQRHASVLFAHGRPAGYEHTVATTWELAFQQLEPDTAPAALLFCCAFLAPEQIPRDLFATEAFAVGGFAGLNGDIALDDAIERLLAFSLVTASDESVSMHRLVQQVVRDRLDAEGRRRWADIAERLVAAAFPSSGDDPVNWPGCERLLPQALAVTAGAAAMGDESAETAGLLESAGLYLHARAQLALASSLYERAIEIKERLAGPEDPDLAGMLARLGNVLGERPGGLAAAGQRLERALAIYERAYGPNDAQVARTLSDLAIVLRRQKRYAEARQRLECALAIYERAYGPNDAQVARTLSDLAIVLRRQKRLAEARPLLKRALEINEMAYGPDHLVVARTLARLGDHLRRQDDLEPARQLLDRALEIYERAYGPDHPRVASTLARIGVLLRRQGELAEARQRLERALVIYERAYGPDHFWVARTLTRLGTVLQALHDVDGAKAVEERARRIRELNPGTT